MISLLSFPSSGEIKSCLYNHQATSDLNRRSIDRVAQIFENARVSTFNVSMKIMASLSDSEIYEFGRDDDAMLLYITKISTALQDCATMYNKSIMNK